MLRLRQRLQKRGQIHNSQCDKSHRCSAYTGARVTENACDAVGCCCSMYSCHSPNSPDGYR